MSIVPGIPTPTWIYGDELFPVLRLKRGEPLRVTLKNELTQHTSIHWHGVRVPNAMDGVPYLTQEPVQPGDSFTYNFAPPDAGTYFFHPHCNTVEQLGRGLVGALIVDEEESRQFDDDLVLILKDWRVARDGQFESFLTLSGASRAGTFGTVRTVNARVSPRFPLAAGALVRLRLINADSTRICTIGTAGVPASVIATDGNPVVQFPLDGWRLGPGMRLDLSLRVPDKDNVALLDYFASEPVTLATFEPYGQPVDKAGTSSIDSPKLAMPDLAQAWFHTLQLGAGVTPDSLPDLKPILLPDGREVDLADSLCLSKQDFWTLDGQAWPMRNHRRLPPPLFSVKRGRTVVLELQNTTSRAHPIHIHGQTMTMLSASILERPRHRADTVLVLPNERATIAFVADNPGNWMIHCHIIEHQETGMMGWFRVS